MIRRVAMHLVAVGTGVGMVSALTRSAGPVPAWLGFLCGWAVTVVSLAQLRVRVHVNEREANGDEGSTDE